MISYDEFCDRKNKKGYSIFVFAMDDHAKYKDPKFYVNQYSNVFIVKATLEDFASLDMGTDPAYLVCFNGDDMLEGKGLPSYKILHKYGEKNDGEE